MTIEHYLLTMRNNGYVPNSILDIGANVGHLSMFCKGLWPTAKILMMEGNENCEPDLLQTGLDYKICLLGDSNKEVEFFMNKKNPKCTGGSYYKEVTRHYSDSVVITKQLSKLDDLVDDGYDIIKIDTQGSELDIMKGGPRTISNSQFVILEVATKQYNQGSPMYDEVVSYMTSIGFDNREEIERHYWMDDDYENFKKGDIFQVDIVFSRNKA